MDRARLSRPARSKITSGRPRRSVMVRKKRPDRRPDGLEGSVAEASHGLFERHRLRKRVRQRHQWPRHVELIAELTLELLDARDPAKVRAKPERSYKLALRDRIRQDHHPGSHRAADLDGFDRLRVDDAVDRPRPVHHHQRSACAQAAFHEHGFGFCRARLSDEREPVPGRGSEESQYALVPEQLERPRKCAFARVRDHEVDRPTRLRVHVFDERPAGLFPSIDLVGGVGHRRKNGGPALVLTIDRRAAILVDPGRSLF